ncbi:MAG: hypothetical protein ACRC2T_08030 [Thermoguttaceae bacterium]
MKKLSRRQLFGSTALTAGALVMKTKILLYSLVADITRIEKSDFLP